MARRPAQYDALLRIRQLQEDQKAQELARTHRSIQATEAARDALADQQMRVLNDAETKTRLRFYARDVGAYYVFERHLNRLRDAQDAELSRLRAIAERQRQELEESMKHRRIVEKLREKKLLAFEAAVRKDDQKLLDEAATNAAARETNEGMSL